MNWEMVTSLGIGSGKIQLHEPQNESELLCLCATGEKFFILGSGSNLLGSDKVNHLHVMRLSKPYFTEKKHSQGEFTFFAGCKLSTIAEYGIEEGFDAAIELAGIPGTMGGALRMNASAHGVAVSDSLVKIRGYFLDGREAIFFKNEIQWLYRSSSLPKNFIIVEAVFMFEKLNSIVGHEKLKKIRAFRFDKQGVGRSAGCVFKNPEGFSAGALIDSCGLKGYRLGGTQVSEKHANFLLNVDHATELDFINLIEEVTRIVKREKKIELKTEIIQISKEYEHEFRTH